LDKETCELPSGWSDTNESENNKITWMCSGVFDHTGKNVSWSKPIRITGKEGKQGADGTFIEFIYALTDTPNYPSTTADKKTTTAGKSTATKKATTARKTTTKK
jgi:hypothetical protein